jgi:hypothetical protein
MTSSLSVMTVSSSRPNYIGSQEEYIEDRVKV